LTVKVTLFWPGGLASAFLRGGPLGASAAAKLTAVKRMRRHEFIGVGDSIP
jgi:hypothetical protein